MTEDRADLSAGTPHAEVFAPRVVDCDGCDNPHWFDSPQAARRFIQRHNRYLGHNAEMRWSDE